MSADKPVSLAEKSDGDMRTPEQPTTQRCGTCGSDDPRLVQTQKGMAEQSIDALCPNKRFHSQPTTGEAGDGL